MTFHSNINLFILLADGIFKNFSQYFILIGYTILFGGSYLLLIFKTAGGVGMAGVGVSNI